MTEAELRSYFGRFATGVAVVAGGNAGEPDAMTVNSLTSVSLDPPLLLFCARAGSRTAGRILETGRFSVNVLSAGQLDVSRRYAGRTDIAVAWTWRERDGFVLLGEANAIFLCTVDRRVLAGDHDIVIGRLVDLDGPGVPAAPLLYYGGRYADLARPGAADRPEIPPEDLWWTG